MSFMRFLDLTIADDIPDSRTVRTFRERLTDLGLIETLFDLFLKELESLNLIVNEGKIVDASFSEAPRQRINRDENTQIKSGEIPKSLMDNQYKLAQKDSDAHRTMKDNEAIKKEKEMEKQVCEKGEENRPSTDEQITINKYKSRRRSFWNIISGLWKSRFQPHGIP